MNNINKIQHIPKTIHYCWFGGNPLPEDAKKYIETWKKHCPDYEIIEWNEKNFDTNINQYTKDAYAARKWAFVSDVARLYALVTHGGIYIDTDVELLKPLDGFLDCEAFSGFESPDSIPTGIMACKKQHPLFKRLLDDYNEAPFIDPDSPDLITNVERITKTCLEDGLELNNKEQTVCGLTLYPNDYFCPKDYRTGRINITSNTYAIHHFSGSWHTEEERYAQQLAVKFHRVLPYKLSVKLGRLFTRIKYRKMNLSDLDTKKDNGSAKK